jgi:uncharacterized protein YbaR (Trm112 family)
MPDIDADTNTNADIGEAATAEIAVPIRICPYPSCRHEWIPRVAKPLWCPRCRRRLEVDEKREAVRLVKNSRKEKQVPVRNEAITMPMGILLEVNEDVPA